MLLCHAAIFSGLFQRPMTGCNALVEAPRYSHAFPQSLLCLLSLRSNCFNFCAASCRTSFPSLLARLFSFAPQNFRLW